MTVPKFNFTRGQLSALARTSTPLPEKSPRPAISPFKSCQWIEGERKNRKVCGDKPLVNGSSYCAVHYAKGYVG